MIVASAALAGLLAHCAPNVAPSTMGAIVAVESGGDPYALNDNTAHRSYAPRDYRDALAVASSLIGKGHSVDVGIAQVNSANFAAFRTNANEMLAPCRNLRVASLILAGDYAQARTVFGEPTSALWHAISAYNTGSLYDGAAYVARVIAAATRQSRIRSISLVTRDRTKNPTAPVDVRKRSTTHLKAVTSRRTDFAFARPNTTTLITTFSSRRHDTATFDDK